MCIRDRKNRVSAIELCHARIVLVSFTKHGCRNRDKGACWGFAECGCKCVPKWLHISRVVVGPAMEHTHDPDSMDAFKRSDDEGRAGTLVWTHGYGLAADDLRP